MHLVIPDYKAFFSVLGLANWGTSLQTKAEIEVGFACRFPCLRFCVPRASLSTATRQLTRYGGWLAPDPSRHVRIISCLRLNCNLTFHSPNNIAVMPTRPNQLDCEKRRYIQGTGTIKATSCLSRLKTAVLLSHFCGQLLPFFFLYALSVGSRLLCIFHRYILQLFTEEARSTQFSLPLLGFQWKDFFSQ